MEKPTFNELAQPNMSPEAKQVMIEAIQKSCDKQVEILKEAERKTKLEAEKFVKMLVRDYGEVLKRLEPVDGPVEPPKLERKCIKNACRCKVCGDIIESKSVHDFKKCKCGAIFTDGGTEYIRRGGDPDNIEDLSEFADERVGFQSF